MNNNGSLIPSEPARAYVYRVLTALGAIAVATGKATGEEVALYLGLAATVLGLVLASANTSTKP
jgi:hypothetical protein